MMWNKLWVRFIAVSSGIIFLAALSYLIIPLKPTQADQQMSTRVATNKSLSKAKRVKNSRHSKAIGVSQPTSRDIGSTLRRPMNWQASSETVPYPDVNQHLDMWIHVSLRKQRVYLMDQNKILYTMYASTGLDTPGTVTPKGTYAVQAERGKYFYNPTVQEGAYYYVSWLDHGTYLFHSTPTDAAGNFIQSDAAKLGKRPSSHGCVHLTVADSKWMYENIRYGTKVVID